LGFPRMQKKKEDAYIKRMAELLRQGATLTDLSCPVCASPLFRLKDGTLWCEKDKKKVIVVKEGQEPPKYAEGMPLDTLEATLLTKVQTLQTKIQHTDDVEELSKLSKALSELLDNLDKIKRMKR
jgi:UPF0148 protein